MGSLLSLITSLRAMQLTFPSVTENWTRISFLIPHKCYPLNSSGRTITQPHSARYARENPCLIFNPLHFQLLALSMLIWISPAISYCPYDFRQGCKRAIPKDINSQLCHIKQHLQNLNLCNYNNVESIERQPHHWFQIVEAKEKRDTTNHSHIMKITFPDAFKDPVRTQIMYS